MNENDQRLRKYLQGLAVVRVQQLKVASAHLELEQKLEDLNKRLSLLERGDHEPLFSQSFGMPSAFEAVTSPRWLN